MTTTVDTVALAAALDQLDAATVVLDAAAQEVADATAAIVAANDVSAIARAQLATGLAAIHAAVTETPDLVPPVARGDAITVRVGITATLDPLANDEPGSSPIAEVRILTQPTLGVITVTGDTWSYAAGPIAGSDTAVYQDIGADGAESVPATIAITVLPASPPPPPPPPPPTIAAVGTHAAMSNQGVGAPTDVIAATDSFHQGMFPKGSWPKVCAVWCGMMNINLMQPGKAIKADTFRRITDNGSRVLLQMPLAFLTNPPGWPASATFAESVLAGRLDQPWADYLGWVASQGQTHPILRLIEPNGAAAMPHAIGHAARADQLDFSDAKAAYTYAFKKWRQLLPTAHIVISHFRLSYVKVAGHIVNVHPDEYSPDPKLYDGDHVDFYDNTGKTMTPANAESLFTEQVTSHAGQKAPVGLDRWADYAKSRNHTCAVDECGIRCKVGDPPERDNAYYVQAMDARAKKLGLMHLAYFRPNGSEHKIWPACNLGTTSARDAFTKVYNVA